MTTESEVIQQLTHPSFVLHVNTGFQVRLQSGKQLSITLTQVSDQQVSARQEEFSIVFRGPLDSFLPQGMYTLTHESMGSFDLFIVPIGRDAEGYSYEAVFNRVRQSS